MLELTSYREARDSRRPLYRASQTAPSWVWPDGTIEWMRPVRPDGTRVRLRDFGEDPLGGYAEYMLALYRSRWPQIASWRESWLAEPRDALACCWCPGTKVAARQLSTFGTFHCHLGVVATVLTAIEVPWRFGYEHANRMVSGA